MLNLLCGAHGRLKFSVQHTGFHIFWEFQHIYDYLLGLIAKSFQETSINAKFKFF